MAIQFPPVNPGDPTPTDGDRFTYAPTQTEYIYDQNENSWSVIIENSGGGGSPVYRLIAGSNLITLDPPDGNLNNGEVTINVVDQLANLGTLKPGSDLISFEPFDGDLRNGDVTVTVTETDELADFGVIKAGSNVTLFPTDGDLRNGNVTITAAENGGGDPPELVIGKLIAGSDLITLDPPDGDLAKSDVKLTVTASEQDPFEIIIQNPDPDPSEDGLLWWKPFTLELFISYNGIWYILNPEEAAIELGNIIAGNNISITGNTDLLAGDVTIDGTTDPLWKKTNNVLSPTTASDDVQVLDSAGGAFLINELANIDSI